MGKRNVGDVYKVVDFEAGILGTMIFARSTNSGKTIGLWMVREGRGEVGSIEAEGDRLTEYRDIDAYRLALMEFVAREQEGYGETSE